MKKILITGATGMVGRALMKELGDPEAYAVRGTGFSRAGGNIDRLDLCDAAAVKAYLAEQRPDVIVHAAAERRPDVSEKNPDATLKLNLEGTRLIAECARDIGAWLIFLSSDYVFDGANPPYKPGDETHPLNFYARTKCEGETIIRSLLDDAAILRVPILYGDVETLSESAVTVIAQTLIENRGRDVVLDAWQTRFPTLVDDVAVVLRQLIDYKTRNPAFGGTLHWSGDEPMTKYDMGLVMARAMGLPTDRILANPDRPGGAPRPKDCHLDCADLERLGIGRRTPFESRIAGILSRFPV